MLHLFSRKYLFYKRNDCDQMKLGIIGYDRVLITRRTLIKMVACTAKYTAIKNLNEN